jgi:hypothetical protein
MDSAAPVLLALSPMEEQPTPEINTGVAGSVAVLHSAEPESGARQGVSCTIKLQDLARHINFR